MRGLARLGRLSARATPVLDPRWLDQAAQTRVRLGIRRPVRLLQSDYSTLLAIWGVLWPKVMVPSGAQAWSDRRIRVAPVPTRLHGIPVDTRMTVTVDLTDRNGPRKLDSALSEIFLGFQAAKLAWTCS